VAESFIVCTGVGRKGKDVLLPGYVRSRTVILLMGVARLSQLIATLVDTSDSQTHRDGVAFPPYTPIAIIERASMPDQRVITSTLKDIVKALDSNGGQRPPGTMVIGWSVLALSGNGDVTVLEDHEELDEERVSRWLGVNNAVRWKVQAGPDKRWESLSRMQEIQRIGP
jgi:uroporphyrin-III C-methyltransferase